MKSLRHTVACVVGTLLAGCGSVDSTPAAPQAEPERAVLVRVLESGPVPACAVLGDERAVVFFNATADRLVSVRLRDARAGLVAAGVGRGFAQPDGVTVTRPALRPGAAAVLAVPRGFVADYVVSGLEAAAGGRVERSHAP